MAENCLERSFYIMSSKFYLQQGKNKKDENVRPWIYIDEIKEYDGIITRIISLEKDT